jgi:hypothetical protein
MRTFYTLKWKSKDGQHHTDFFYHKNTGFLVLSYTHLCYYPLSACLEFAEGLLENGISVTIEKNEIEGSFDNF